MPHDASPARTADRERARARHAWMRARAALERSGGRRRDPRWFDRVWRPLRKALIAIDDSQRLRHLYWRGVRNALDIRLERRELAFAALPAAFDGYTILHLSDTHFGKLEETAERLRACVAGVEADACVLTGDYAVRYRDHPDEAVGPLGAVFATLTLRDGVFAVLGNHDGVALVAPLEDLGVRVLVNETAVIARDGARLHLTGLDDVHYFASAEAFAALRAAPSGFKIALVHSAEAAKEAAAAGFALYLAGHTHGGQVCLPGGWPIVTNQRCRRAYARGLWRCGDMTGYTSRGIGVSFLPVRFNSSGEAALITLRRAAG